MFKKFLIIFIFIIGFTIIENVSAECVHQIGGSYYDIKFVTNGGNNLENMNLCATCADFENAQLPTPTRDGYDFLNWYADENLTIPVSSIKNDLDQTSMQVEYDGENCPTGKINVTLYAKWEKLDCPIMEGGTGTFFQFETNGGNKIDVISICHTCGNSLDDWQNTTLPIPSKNGYIFDGWYANKSLKTKVESIKDSNIIFDRKLDEDECSDGSWYTTLYAKWEKIDCPIMIGGSSTIFQFETNGGNVVDEISICHTCADAFEKFKNTSLPITIKDGYTFKGWYADNDLTNKVDSLTDENIIFENVVDENGCSDGSKTTTLYAKWEKNTVVDVDSTGSSISSLLMILSCAMIVIGLIIYLKSINIKQKN